MSVKFDKLKIYTTSPKKPIKQQNNCSLNSQQKIKYNHKILKRQKMERERNGKKKRDY